MVFVYEVSTVRTREHVWCERYERALAVAADLESEGELVRIVRIDASGIEPRAQVYVSKLEKTIATKSSDCVAR